MLPLLIPDFTIYRVLVSLYGPDALYMYGLTSGSQLWQDLPVDWRNWNLKVWSLEWL